MSQPVISLEHVSKRYDLGQRQARSEGLRHALERAARAPFAWLRGGRTRAAGADEFWALRDVTLDVAQGEVIGIIGRNGAGKSTLLKILSRITEPTEGRIRLRGTTASLLEVGTGFHPELTGRENIFLNGAILGMSRVEIAAKFDEIVAFAEVERFLDTPVKRYSSGMYVRLAFAVAAHLEPEILIVDEVLAVGDAQFQQKCLGKMQDVSRHQGRTVLLVSHQMATIEHLCTRSVLMEQGRVLHQGTTDSVIDAYLARTRGQAVADLGERRDRQGRQDVRIVGIDLCDADGQVVREAISGKTTILRLRFSVAGGRTLRNCRVSLAVQKDMKLYFCLSTDFVDRSPLELSGEGVLEFEVPDWPLSVGSYVLDAFVSSDSDAVVQDWIQQAALVEVVDGDYFGTGRLYHPGWGGRSVLVRHSYTVRRPSLAAHQPRPAGVPDIVDALA